MADFYGTSDNDNFIGGSSADTFVFAAGTFSSRNDIVIGGAGGGDRLIISGSGPVDLYGITINPWIGSVQGIEEVYLPDTPFWTDIWASAVNSASGVLSVFGGSGNDRMSSARGSGELQTGTLYFYGGAGNDDLSSYAGSSDGLFGGDGNDQLRGRAVYMDGGAGDDRFEMYAYSTALGGAGADSFTALDNNSQMFGGSDNDNFQANASSRISADGGDDIIILSSNFVSSFGSAYLAANAGYAYGGDGNDNFFFSATSVPQAMLIDGGAGYDKLTLYGSFDASQTTGIEEIFIDASVTSSPTLTLSLLQLRSITLGGYANGTAPLKFVLSGSGYFDFGAGFFAKGVDVTMVNATGGVFFYGSGRNDTLRGGDFADYLITGDGNDNAYGGFGADYLAGGSGDDSLYGGGGNDYFIGEDGNDYIETSNYYYGSPGLGGSSYAFGGEGNDTLIAIGLNDVLWGGNGYDHVISYSKETAWLYGGDGDDVLEGDNGNDLVSGDAGNDTLSGWDGVDYFVGGAGTDYFVMTGDDFYGSYDIISDFTAGVDFIALDAYWQTKGLILDTAYGVSIYYADATGTYQILVTNTHSVSAVTAGIYYI